eukprot:TRINITY_DN13907_c0_g1_i2.p1 TRINITY_DN13907_c0_g1~~TRINITY_DN13907_c0_g1_i2.p1  ORF type:complete len:381 (+),score=98.88 TRINITY_DN13907_c0_g1_i2:39-1145(+)
MAEDRRRSSQRGVMTPVFVAVRLKPLGVGRSDSMREAAGCAGKRVERYDDTTITMDGCTFGFPRVVVGPDVEQAESYQLLLPHLLSAWLEGFDVNFLAFGQTGSGKTHTIFGPPGSMQFAAKDAEEARGASGESLTRAPYGVLPRAGLAAMDFLAERGDGVLSGSMIELHFDTVFDLLNDHAPCSINDDHEVQGAKQVPLDSATDLLRLAAQVEQRTTNATRMNDTSSRSHCVTTFTLTRKAGDGKVIVSRFRFVDLAGSERAEEAHDPGVSVKSHVSGWEGITTNYSLSQFKLCAQRAYAISLGRKEHVPFRDCNLTRLLHGSLVGSALTGLVITLSLRGVDDAGWPVRRARGTEGSHGCRWTSEGT